MIKKQYKLRLLLFSRTVESKRLLNANKTSINKTIEFLRRKNALFGRLFYLTYSDRLGNVVGII